MVEEKYAEIKATTILFHVCGKAYSANIMAYMSRCCSNKRLSNEWMRD
jgi:hypothetical protein